VEEAKVRKERASAGEREKRGDLVYLIYASQKKGKDIGKIHRGYGGGKFTKKGGDSS